MSSRDVGSSFGCQRPLPGPEERLGGFKVFTWGGESSKHLWETSNSWRRLKKHKDSQKSDQNRKYVKRKVTTCKREAGKLTHLTIPRQEISVVEDSKSC